MMEYVFMACLFRSVAFPGFLSYSLALSIGLPGIFYLALPTGIGDLRVPLVLKSYLSFNFLVKGQR